MTPITTATATALTAEQVLAILTTPLEQASTFLAAGPRVFDTAGPLRIPGAPADGSASLAFTGEGQQITESDPDFTELSLMPSTMKSVKTIARYSNELARQSVVALESALRDRLVNDVAGKLDAAFYSASGDGITTPRGMFAWTGTQSVALTGPLTLDAILNGQALALAANVAAENLRLFLRPADYMALRAIKDGDQRYMLQPDAALGAVPTVLGLPVTVSARIPAGKAGLADMSQVAVARDLDPSVTVLSERYADTDEQAIRVVARYDVAPINPQAVVTFSGITAEP